MSYKQKDFLTLIFLFFFMLLLPLETLEAMTPMFFDGNEKGKEANQNKPSSEESLLLQIKREREREESRSEKEEVSHSLPSIPESSLPESKKTLTKRFEYSLTEIAEALFSRAKNEDTTTAWNEAASKAHEIAKDRRALLEELTDTNPNYSELLLQQRRWEQKAITAEIRAEARKKEPEAYTFDDIISLLNFVRNKTQPAFEEALDRVLNGDHSAAAIAEVRRVASDVAYTYAAANAYTPTYAPPYPPVSAYVPASAYAASATRYSYTSGYVSAATYAYAAAASPSSSEAFNFFQSASKLHKDLQQAFMLDQSFYDESPERKTYLNEREAFFEGSIAIADKVAGFALIMKEIKAEEERINPSPYWELEKSGISAFEIALQAKTTSKECWNNALNAAKDVVKLWNEAIEKKQLETSLLPFSLEEMKVQKERWRQKVFLAELRMKEPENYRDSFQDLNHFVRVKIQDLVQPSMNDFITHPHEAVFTRGIDVTRVEDEAEQLELQVRDWENVISRLGANAYNKYSLEIVTRTADFLRTLASFKRDR